MGDHGPLRRDDLTGVYLSREELWSREFGTSQALWAKGVAAAGGAVYVLGEDGTAQVRDDLEHFAAFTPATRRAPVS